MIAHASQGRTTRGYATRILWGVARGVALVWLVPALLFNVDWTGHGSWQANLAAVVMILGSALFIEGGLRFRDWVLTPLCVLAALFLVYVNTKQATRTLSFASEAASEAKSKDIAGGSQVASQRSQLEKRRAMQVQVAEEAAAGTLQAALAGIIASDPTQWRVSSQCEAPNGPITGAFCTRVAAAKAKIEAAKTRDAIDAELSALPRPSIIVTADGKTDAVADSYVANIKAMANELGYKPSERIIKAEEALTRALGFELLAALGPTCWLHFMGGLMLGTAALSARRGRKPKAAPAAAAEKPEPARPESADDIDRMIADEFEDAPGGVMKAKDIRPIARAWFEARGVKIDENKLWARMRECFRHDPNNNRPRYIGLKPRTKAKSGPRLAIVNE